MFDPTSSDAWLLWSVQTIFMLGFGFAYILVVLGIFLIWQRVDRTMKQSQQRAVAPGLRGLSEIFMSQLLASLLGWFLKTALTTIIPLLGIVLFALIKLGQTEAVRGAASRLSMETAGSVPPDGGDFLILYSLFVIGTTIIAGGALYIRLRHVARDWRKRAAEFDTPPVEPQIVRYFAEVRLSGLILMFFMLYPIAVMVSLITGTIVSFAPLPQWLTQVSIEGADTVVIWLMLLLWIGMMASFAAPFAALFRRRISMTINQYRSNRPFQFTVKFILAMNVGVVGFLAVFVLQNEIGAAVFPCHFRSSIQFSADRSNICPEHPIMPTS